MKQHLVGNVHLIAGSKDQLPELLDFLEDTGIKTKGNPDLYIKQCGILSVEEAREIRARAGSRALGESPRVFVVACAGMNAEAQNTLLKTLEEPPADAMFFFLLPSPQMLLPTLRSRAQTLAISGVHISSDDVDNFLAAAPKKRLEILKTLLEKEKNTERDLGAILAFLSSLEVRLGQGLPEAASGLEAVYRARKYAADKGALLKPLLEQVALLI